MKMSKSERSLMVMLIALLIVGGYYKFFYIKENQRIETLRAEKNIYDDKLQDIKLKVSMSTKREKDIKILNAKIQDNISSIYPVIQQDRLIIELDDLLKKSNVEGSFSFSEVKVAETDNKTNNNAIAKTPTNAANNAKDSQSLQTIVDQYNSLVVSEGNKTTVSTDKKNIKGSTQYMQVSLAFKGTYDNIIGLIKNIENYRKKIVISNLALNASNTGELTGTATLEFNSIPKFAGMDDDYFKWDYNNPYGKQNPFTSGNAKNNAVSTTIEDSSKPKVDAKDFVMSVRSVSSDLPAIMLGSSNDNERKTYVYGDENRTDAVEITFVEVGGKFYYKYKVGNSSYPQQYSGNGVEFTPANKDISMAIFSVKRMSDTDKAGADINVINKTSRIADIYVSNDDGAKPRISVRGEGSAVNTKNQ